MARNNSIRRLLILTDCKSAIDILTGQNEIRKNLKELQRLWKVIGKAGQLGIKCKLIWIPGHADIELNEEADRLAKDGSRMEVGCQQENVQRSVIERWIKEKTKDRWNRAWKMSETGWWTKELIGKVGRKLKFPAGRSAGMSYVRLLINNTAVNENMYRFGLVEDRGCECEEGIQSVHRVLLECRNEQEQREKLKSELGKLWMDESKKVGDLQFDLRLILAPFSIDKIDETLAEKMLLCTFKFLSSLTKIL